MGSGTNRRARKALGSRSSRRMSTKTRVQKTKRPRLRLGIPRK